MVKGSTKLIYKESNSSENILKFDNPEEDWKIVKSKWMDYANSTRQKNQIKKFK